MTALQTFAEGALTLEQWQHVEALARTLTPAQARWISGYFAGLDAGLLRAGAPAADAAEHVRRARAVASLMSRAGLHVLVALDLPASEAWPGRPLSPADLEQEGGAEWVI